MAATLDFQMAHRTNLIDTLWRANVTNFGALSFKVSRFQGFYFSTHLIKTTLQYIHFFPLRRG